jgi:hypothetical protein
METQIGNFHGTTERVQRAREKNQVCKLKKVVYGL